MQSWVRSHFDFAGRRTTWKRETIAGLTTFMTMAYIIFVNPMILGGAGIPFNAAMAATCLGAAIPTFIMGYWTNYPIALASGMGLNAALVMEAQKPGMTWETMMGVIVVEGVIIGVLVMTHCREKIMNAIPANLKLAISAGIGVFIAFLGLQHMGWVVQGQGGAFLAHGSFTLHSTVIASIGLIVLIGLMIRRVRGSILIGILATAVIALGWEAISKTSGEGGGSILPAQWMALPDFSTFAQADILGALRPALAGVIFAFLITDFFDTMGSVIGIGTQAGLLDDQGKVPRLKRVLLVDSFAAAWGGFCGASSVTTYIESAAGTSAGGRTGWVCIVVGLCFLIALFFSPIIGMVPAVATAPALLVVGFLMTESLRHINFVDLEEGIPAFLTILLIPLTQGISFGIGMGFITYVLLKLLAGKGRSVSPWLYGVAIVFIFSFALS